MRFQTLGLVAGLAASALAEDLLFIDTFQAEEYSQATGALGFTAKVVTEAEWRAMTTADFGKFKAIVIADNFGDSYLPDIQFLDDTKAVWSPAVTGNVILIGGDPSNHFAVQPGAQVLIDNAVKFAAAGTSTGFYWALSQFYDQINNDTVSALSEFGDFEVRGNLACYNEAHIVASSPALATLTDAALSDWSCSVHEAFLNYPTTGLGGFQALAIAKDILGQGSQSFGDGTMGLPYIISRGATPAGCGNGIWEPQFGEECDDGSKNGAPGDGCSASCKCLSGRPSGQGTCLPSLSTGGASSSVSATPGKYGNTTTSTMKYGNSTVTTTVSSVSTTTPVTIIGVEIIVEIIIIENCQTNGAVTITSYITSTCSTLQRPIWNTPNPAYPCYPCQMASQGISCPSNGFITAITTICPSCPGGVLPTPVLPVVQTCQSCQTITLLTAPTCQTTGTSFLITAPTLTASHEHAATTPVPTTAQSVGAVQQPTTSPLPFVGAAAGQSVAFISVLGGAVLAMIALL